MPGIPGGIPGIIGGMPGIMGGIPVGIQNHDMLGKLGFFFFFKCHHLSPVCTTQEHLSSRQGECPVV